MKTPLVGQIDHAAMISQRLNGRTSGIFNLQVEGIDDGGKATGPIVLTGRAGSYYAKQLALQATQEVLGSHVEIRNEIDVRKPAQRRP